MIISLFNSVYDAYVTPNRVINEDWEVIQEILCNFNEVKEKEDAPMFNLWEFKTLDEGAELGRKWQYKDGKKTGSYTEIPNTVRRCKENAKGVWGIVLDYDGGKTIAEAEAELVGLEYVLFTSFRHSDNINKFRVVLPFDQVMSKQDLLVKEEDIRSLFTRADTASFSLSQAFYMHSGPNKEIAVAKRNRGVFLNGDMFKNKVIAPVVAAPKSAVIGNFTLTDKYKEKVANALLTCSGVRRGASSGNGGALTLASICKSIDLSYEEFAEICDIVTAYDSTMRDPVVKQQTWNDCTYTRISNAKRDQFIKQHGGTPPESREDKLVLMNTLAKKYSVVVNQSRSKDRDINQIIEKYGVVVKSKEERLQEIQKLMKKYK